MQKDTNPKDALGTAKWRNFVTVPFQVLWELGIAMLEGSLKYGRHNYRASGVRASVYVDAALGHIHQYWEGEDDDPDSAAHLSHITKAIASLTVLRDAQMNDFLVDDRPPAILNLDGVRTKLQAAADSLWAEHADKNPHHYSQLEDGAPYQDDDEEMSVEAEVFTRFGEGEVFKQMVAEEQSRRYMKASQELKVAAYEQGVTSPGDVLEDDVRDVFYEIGKALGMSRSDAKRELVAQGIEIVARPTDDPIQKAVDMARGSDQPPSFPLMFSSGRLKGKVARVGDVSVTDFDWDADGVEVGVDAGSGAASLESHVAHLEDPSYQPGKLAILQDDDPVEIMFPDRDSTSWNKDHIVEGLTTAQVDRLIDHEAKFCGLACNDTETAFTMLRRVLLRLKSQPLRAVQLRWANAYSDRSTRLTQDQWLIAQPDLLGVYERQGATPLMPGTFA